MICIHVQKKICDIKGKHTQCVNVREKKNLYEGEDVNVSLRYIYQLHWFKFLLINGNGRAVLITLYIESV